MTSRRVIFPDPEIWTRTQKQEHHMAQPPTNPAASDCRRAVALVSHHTNAHPDGVNAIIDEANEAGRGTELVFSVLHFFQALVPELRTDAALAGMSQRVTLIAELDEDPDWRRAATMIVADSASDVDLLNRAINEATHDNRTGQLLLAINDLYAQLLPELDTPLGREVLSKWTARIAEQENTP